MLKETGRWRLARAALLFPFFFSCSSLFYYPSQDFYYSPTRLGFTAREVPFRSKDGTPLYGWFFPAEKTSSPKGTIIQFHGNAENMSSHYLSLVWLVKEGYDLFTFDYRGYGKSEGEPSQRGTYEDALAALDVAWKFHQERRTPRFVVFGQSLGGAVAARALKDFPHKDRVSLLVMDSTFVSYKDVSRRKLAGFWLSWPFSPLAMILISDEYSAEQALAESKTRLLVIHSKKDPAVPFAGAQEFYEQSTAPQKEFWELDSETHIGAFGEANSPYRERFVRLLGSLPSTPASQN